MSKDDSRGGELLTVNTFLGTRSEVKIPPNELCLPPHPCVKQKETQQCESCVTSLIRLRLWFRVCIKKGGRLDFTNFGFSRTELHG